jgi:hypothetical protein
VIFVFRHGTLEEDTTSEMLSSIRRVAHASTQMDLAPFMLIHGSDVNERLEMNARKFGVTLVLGGHPQDINSLSRVRQVFEYFDTVVTDYIGSHVLYAMICGAHVSFIDPVEEWRAPNNSFFRNNPLNSSTRELRNRLVSNASAMKETIQGLVLVDKESALVEAGYINLPPVTEINHLVGWDTNSLKLPTDFARVIQGNLWLAARAVEFLRS